MDEITPLEMILAPSLSGHPIVSGYIRVGSAARRDGGPGSLEILDLPLWNRNACLHRSTVWTRLRNGPFSD
jgi:hypothetical protein